MILRGAKQSGLDDISNKATLGNDLRFLWWALLHASFHVSFHFFFD